ncbi:MAG TPA: PEGA domain-containing protein [Polyangiaceae bacterium]
MSSIFTETSWRWFVVLGIVLVSRTSHSKCPYGRDPKGRCLDAAVFMEPRPEPQQIIVNTYPEGATVIVDEKPVVDLRTPFTFPGHLEAGLHEFQISLEGYESIHFKHPIGPFGKQRIDKWFVKYSRLSVRLADDADCDITIDREPQHGRTVDKYVVQGQHQVLCERNGYVSFLEWVHILQAGEQRDVFVPPLRPQESRIRLGADLIGVQVKLWRDEVPLQTRESCEEIPESAVSLKLPTEVRSSFAPGRYCVASEAGELRRTFAFELKPPATQVHLKFLREPLHWTVTLDPDDAKSRYGSCMRVVTNANVAMGSRSNAAMRASFDGVPRDDLIHACIDLGWIARYYPGWLMTILGKDLKGLTSRDIHDRVGPRLYDAACQLGEPSGCAAWAEYLAGLNIRSVPQPEFDAACKMGVENACWLKRYRSEYEVPSPAILIDIHTITKERWHQVEPGLLKSYGNKRGSSYLGFEIAANPWSVRAPYVVTVGVLNWYSHALDSTWGVHLGTLAVGGVRFRQLDVTRGTMKPFGALVTSLLDAEIRYYVGSLTYFSMSANFDLLHHSLQNFALFSASARAGIGAAYRDWGITVGVRAMTLPTDWVWIERSDRFALVGQSLVFLPNIQVETGVALKKDHAIHQPQY